MPLGPSSNSSQQGTKHSAKHSCDLSWCWWSWATWCYELLHVAANHDRCSPCISLTTGDLKSFWTSRTWTGSSIFTMLVMEKLNPNRWHSLAQFEGEEQVMSISETPPDASLDDGDLPLPRHRPSIKSCWSFTTTTMAMWLRSCMARREWFKVLRQTKVHLLNLKSHMYASQRLYKRFQLITYQFAVTDKYRYYSYLGMPILPTQVHIQGLTSKSNHMTRHNPLMHLSFTSKLTSAKVFTNPSQIMNRGSVR